MKKYFIIFSILALMVLIGWFFLGRGTTPIVDVLRNNLPFGSGENLAGSNNEGGSTTEGEGGVSFDEFGQPTATLFRLAVEPVAGAVAFNKSSTTAAVRYVDRATGHIFEIILPTGNASGALEKKKITNRTLPKIYEAYFRLDGNAVLMRSLQNDSDTVENISLTLTPPRATSTDGLYNVSATTLRGDIESVAVGLGNTLYYSLKDSGSMVSSAFNNTALKTLLTSAFTDWRLSAAGNTVMVYTKASSNAPGYAYLLNLQNGALTKVLGPLDGLTVTPNASGTHVLYSYLENGLSKSMAKNLQSGATTGILPVTFSEKCTWSVRNKGIAYCGSPRDGINPGELDNWYRGATHFSDRLWRFDTNGEIAQVLSEPKASLGLDIDVVEPKLSPNEDYLIFMNKRDLSLWALKLEQF